MKKMSLDAINEEKKLLFFRFIVIYLLSFSTIDIKYLIILYCISCISTSGKNEYNKVLLKYSIEPILL